MQQTEWYESYSWFLNEVPTQNRNLDAYVTLQTKYLLYVKDYAAAVSLLGKNCFPTYAKARDDLINMWFLGQEGLALLQKQSVSPDTQSLNALERHQARIKNPPPDNIGCQYAAEVNNFRLFLFKTHTHNLYKSI